MAHPAYKPTEITRDNIIKIFKNEKDISTN
jgi:hypothetical protein